MSSFLGGPFELKTCFQSLVEKRICNFFVPCIFFVVLTRSSGLPLIIRLRLESGLWLYLGHKWISGRHTNGCSNHSAERKWVGENYNTDTESVFEEKNNSKDYNTNFWVSKNATCGSPYRSCSIVQKYHESKFMLRIHFSLCTPEKLILCQEYYSDWLKYSLKWESKCHIIKNGDCLEMSRGVDISNK